MNKSKKKAKHALSSNNFVPATLPARRKTYFRQYIFMELQPTEKWQKRMLKRAIKTFINVRVHNGIAMIEEVGPRTLSFEPPARH